MHRAEGNSDGWRIVRTIQEAERFKPAVIVLEKQGRQAVLKDYSSCNHLFRWLARCFLVPHEADILNRLRGVRGVPGFAGFRGAHGIMIEYVRGNPVNLYKGRNIPSDVIERLRELIDAMHNRGVAHIDLRQRKNILLTESYEPYLIDFTSAVFLGNQWLGRLFLSILKWIDRSGLVKMKSKYFPHLLTDDDRKFLARQRIVRRLWIFRPARRRTI